MSDKTSIFYDLNQFVRHEDRIPQYTGHDTGHAVDTTSNKTRSSWYGELIHQALVDCFHEENLPSDEYRHDSKRSYLGESRMLARRKLFWPPKWIDLLLRVVPRLLVGGLAALLQVHQETGRTLGIRRFAFFVIGGAIWMPFRLLSTILSPIVSPINVVIKPILKGMAEPNGRFGMILLASVVLAGAAAAIIFTGGLGLVLPAAVGSFLSALALPLWANIVAVAGTLMMSVGLLNKVTGFEYKEAVKQLQDVEMMPRQNHASGGYPLFQLSKQFDHQIQSLGFAPNYRTQDKDKAFEYDDGPSIR